MSLGVVRPRRRKDTGAWQVRWEEGDRFRSRSFRLKNEAIDFYDELVRRHRFGLPGIDAGRVTLSEFVEDSYWRDHAAANLSLRTQASYALTWAKHIQPRLGWMQLRSVTPKVVAKFRADLEAANVGRPTVIRSLALLQGIFKLAVVYEHVASNPVAAVRKPRQPKTRKPEPLAPEVVERIRGFLGSRDATLVSVLAYAGLRPEEALGLRWRDIHGGRLYVAAGKTGRERWVDLLGPLATDLAELRLGLGRPADGELMFGEWSEADWRNWRRRVYQGCRERRPPTSRHPEGPVRVYVGAAQKAGVTGDMRPYRLRSSFVSLLLWAGHPLTYVADQAGHSVDVLARHYAGVIADLEGQPRVSADEAIRKARGKAQEATG